MLNLKQEEIESFDFHFVVFNVFCKNCGVKCTIVLIRKYFKTLHFYWETSFYL